MLSCLGAKKKEPLGLEPIRLHEGSGEEISALLREQGVNIEPKAQPILLSSLYRCPREGELCQPAVITSSMLGRRNTDTDSAAKVAAAFGLIAPPITLISALCLAVKDGWMEEQRLRRLVVAHPYVPGGPLSTTREPQRLHLGIYLEGRECFLAAFADYPGFLWGRGVGWVYERPGAASLVAKQATQAA